MAKEWLEKYEDKRGTKIQNATASAALEAAKEDGQTVGDKVATAHTKTFKDFGIQSVSKVQGDALTWFIARCFFTCVIPFKEVEHWPFVGMSRALAPGVVRHLPSRRGLSRAWLPNIYLETRDRMIARLEKKGKKTLILDGYKDRRNCHVINIAWGVRGFFA